MCYVPAGNFTWGQGDEIQTIDYDYEIMKYEVTNAQFITYLEESYAAGAIEVTDTLVVGYYNGDENYDAGEYGFYELDSEGRISWNGNNFIIQEGYEEHPVIEVSWFGSNAYAEYYGLRLPTEQEWEKAARGLTGYEFPWGNVLSGDRANYDGSGDPWERGTTPVGIYNGLNYSGFQTTDTPSPYGCYDMCGNVCEWTESWASPTHPAYVFRGGAWDFHSNITHLRSWTRGDGYPSFMNDDVGFRCAKTVE